MTFDFFKFLVELHIIREFCHEVYYQGKNHGMDDASWSRTSTGTFEDAIDEAVYDLNYEIS
jgi:hypothetical protein